MKADIRLLLGPLRLALTGAFGLMTTSCFYVWQEPIRYGQGGQPVVGEQTEPEPGTLEELQAKREDSENSGDNLQSQGPREATPPPELPAREATTGIPVAKKVPGRKGFVFSPYNNKLIDVEGIPTGSRVRDPRYPESENKFFKVP